MPQEQVIVATMGFDHHENGAISVARILEQAQMNVNYMGRFNTPDKVASQAIADDVDVIGISCHSWEYLTLIPSLLELVKASGRDIPIVIGGSVITDQDAEEMKKMGVAAVFNGAPTDDEIIDGIRDVALRKRGKLQTE